MAQFSCYYLTLIYRVCSYINSTEDMKASWSHGAFAAVSGCQPHKATVKEEMAQREVMTMEYEKLQQNTVMA